jgi:hypothetical protein
MTAATPPGPADTIAAELRKVADPILAEVAQLLADVPEEQLFGDTEFAVRDRILRLVAAAYAARLAGKKTATAAPASRAPGAGNPPPSTASATGPR